MITNRTPVESRKHPLVGAELIADAPDDDGLWLYRLVDGTTARVAVKIEATA